MYNEVKERLNIKNPYNDKIFNTDPGFKEKALIGSILPGMKAFTLHAIFENGQDKYTHIRDVRMQYIPVVLKSQGNVKDMDRADWVTTIDKTGELIKFVEQHVNHASRLYPVTLDKLTRIMTRFDYAKLDNDVIKAAKSTLDVLIDFFADIINNHKSFVVDTSRHIREIIDIADSQIG